MQFNRTKIQWQDSVEEFRDLWAQEPSPERRSWLHALILLQVGFPQADVSRMVPLNASKLHYLISSYRRKGVLHALGYMVRKGAYLTFEQQRALVAHSQQTPFNTLQEAIDWIDLKWNVRYTVASIRNLFDKLNIRTKAQRQNSG
ncbi:MAG: hypothetical protein ACPG8W_24235 [Candidatus Promineifilaceae bacterium]